LRQGSKEERDLFIQIQEDHLSDVYHKSRQHLDEIVANCPAGKVLEDLKKHLFSFLEDIYFPVASAVMDDNQYDWWKNNMPKKSFFELLNKNGSLVRALALLGNACSIDYSREFIAQCFDRYDMDLNATIASLSQYEELSGALGLTVTEKMIACFI
jgi:hypothetical protein